MPRDLIAEDFDRARQAMLQEFRALVLVHPVEAEQEIATTLSAMRQVLRLARENTNA